MHRKRTRSAQTIIFLIMVIVILTFVVMWNFDLHKIIHTKAVTQNAGDAAALMAARWQGITLNLIGELNVMQALALASGDGTATEAVTNIQTRLCYVGPMIAFMASQQAAKQNGIYVHEGFTQRVREHANRVRYDYPTRIGPNGGMLFTEPWPDAWQEYADMLDTVADNGIAAAPDNTRLYTDYSAGHPLIDVGFYEAITGRIWCWFHDNYRNYNVPPADPPVTLLEGYRNFHPCWWPDIPPPPRPAPLNSEVFGLGLETLATDLRQTAEAMGAAGTPLALSPGTGATNALWFTYDPASWSAWEAIAVDGPDRFPVVGPVRPPYDYTGADAVVRIEADVTRLSPGAGGAEIRHTITWTAAAKSFGHLNDEDRPNAYDIVLPAFRQMRLIPVAASSAPSGGAYNLAWRVHLETHLPAYLNAGPPALEPNCWYCRCLDGHSGGWEHTAFRQAGVDWLAVPANVQTCLSGPGGGPGGGGGTRIAH